MGAALAGSLAMSALRTGGAGHPALAVLRVTDLPYALAGEPDFADDLELPPSCVVGFPDRGDEGGVRGFLAGLVTLVLVCEPAHLVGVHDPTIQCANHLDKRPPGRP